MLTKIAEVLKGVKSVNIVTHVNPDGDAIGSSFGLKFILEKCGISAEVVLGAPLHAEYKFTGYKPITPQEAKPADAAVGVDFGEVSRTDCREIFEKAPIKIIIDHHIVKQETGDLFFSNPKAAACCENIFLLGKKLGVETDSNIAAALYMGIMTDTGGCRYGSTTKDTHLILSELIDLVDHAYINRMTLELISRAKFEARKKLFPEMESYCGGKVNVFTADLSYEDEEALNGLVNIAVNLEGAICGVTFKQRDENTVKVSLRTVGDFNGAEICAAFGGGGHFNASGCTINLPLSEAKEQFIKYLLQRIEEF